jgi:hypothetical protein
MFFRSLTLAVIYQPMSKKEIQIRTNPSAKMYFLLNDYLVNPISLPLIGEGTYIKYTGGSKWAHIKLKIQETENHHSGSIIWNIPEPDFPKVFEDEIVEALRTFLIHYEGLTGENLNVTFEILEANYHEVETGKGNFYFAVANSIFNAFDISLHEPNIEAVRKYKT